VNAAERPVAVWLVLSMLASVGFGIAYALDANGTLPHGNQWLGGSIAAALGCAGVATILWSIRLVPPEQVLEERHDVPSSRADRGAAGAELTAGVEVVSRRRGLARLLGGAVGALGLASLFPLRSLVGENPDATLGRTKWTAGARLVREDGSPLRAADIDEGSVATVFPEGFAGDADSQTMLVRLHPSLLRGDAAKASWSPDGFIAYSKVCTHAGCPVALYRNDIHALVCPCHQSAFDVTKGATPIEGPAERALPQLPLRREGEYLVAQSPYPEPVGPSWWDRR